MRRENSLALKSSAELCKEEVCVEGVEIFIYFYDERFIIFAFRLSFGELPTGSNLQVHERFEVRA